MRIINVLEFCLKLCYVNKAEFIDYILLIQHFWNKS